MNVFVAFELAKKAAALNASDPFVFSRLMSRFNAGMIDVQDLRAMAEGKASVS